MRLKFEFLEQGAARIDAIMGAIRVLLFERQFICFHLLTGRRWRKSVSVQLLDRIDELRMRHFLAVDRVLVFYTVAHFPRNRWRRLLVGCCVVRGG